MEKFILNGRAPLGSILKLKIPSKKIYDEGDMTVKQILRGENNDISCDEDIYDSLYTHRSPVTMRSELSSCLGVTLSSAQFIGSHLLQA